ncbi:MAG: sulfatase-like hydrolase/transferase, partial [Planctomycetes bacterium]|nr:sulfatase-like hydrolase/transferase [Planctomycetota bacterium]
MFRSGAAPCLPRAADRTFVLIIADDQAFGDFGFMGHPVIATPRLDRLAAEGVVFERGYVPSSLCRPSLMSMITGLPPHRHGVTGNDPPKGTPRAKMLAHIDAAETLPARLCAVGYRSLQTGKWWEGSYRRGGFTAGMTHGDPARGGRHGDDGLDIGRKTMQPIFDFVDADPAVPFFLWYAPMLPHAPHDPPERLLAKYTAPGRSLHLARYFAMCEWFDETCGALLDHLERRGLRDDTLVLFVVDNGWIQRPDHRG